MSSTDTSVGVRAVQNKKQFFKNQIWWVLGILKSDFVHKCVQIKMGHNENN